MMYRTASGSLYEVEGNRVRRVERSSLSQSIRVGSSWREAEDIIGGNIGQPLTIYWRRGLDALSPEDAIAELNTRWTTTSPVVEITQ